MRKQFWVWASILLLALAFGLTIFNAQAQREVRERQAALAAEGAETHAWACLYKADLETKVADGKAFLAMTPEQRIEKYGTALGGIPESVIRNSLVNQRQNLETASVLNCP